MFSFLGVMICIFVLWLIVTALLLHDNLRTRIWAFLTFRYNKLVWVSDDTSSPATLHISYIDPWGQLVAKRGSFTVYRLHENNIVKGRYNDTKWKYLDQRPLYRRFLDLFEKETQ